MRSPGPAERCVKVNRSPCMQPPVIRRATRLKYTWKLNDAPQGAEGPDFSFTPNNAGDFKVEVSVTDSTDPKRTVTAGPRTVTVLDYTPPQISGVTATPSTLSCSAVPNGVHSAALSGIAAVLPAEGIFPISGR